MSARKASIIFIATFIFFPKPIMSLAGLFFAGFSISPRTCSISLTASSCSAKAPRLLF
ncbi:ABC transporter permease [Listeria monocytogenes]|nr:ABC transporter permease [Listeria monocytogenes]